MRFIMMMFYLALALFCIGFAALNAGSVVLNLYFRTFNMPISVLMFLTFSVGILMGCLILSARYWCLRASYRKLKHQLQMTEREIKNLRTIPLKD